MMLPAVPGKERPGFLRRVFAVLMESGTAGMPEEEFEDLRDRLREILDRARPGEEAAVDDVAPAPGGG